ncbi:MAG: hypothetical protein JWR16_977 [Nevskia sp.]|nr:hypothetical protein [Nevskia sp.]
MRRQTGAVPERACEVAWRKLAFARDLNQANVLMHVLMHEFLGAALLPRREPAMWAQHSAARTAVDFDAVCVKRLYHMIEKAAVRRIGLFESLQQASFELPDDRIAQGESKGLTVWIDCNVVAIGRDFDRGDARIVEMHAIERLLAKCCGFEFHLDAADRPGERWNRTLRLSVQPQII